MKIFKPSKFLIYETHLFEDVIISQKGQKIIFNCSVVFVGEIGFET